MGFKEFNGVANGASPMEDEDLFYTDKGSVWKLPEDTEEAQKVKGIYPVVSVTRGI